MSGVSEADSRRAALMYLLMLILKMDSTDEIEIKISFYDFV